VKDKALCDLCKNRKHIARSILCGSCQEAISRLMVVAEWEAQRGRDKQRNMLQAEILEAYLKVKAVGK